MDNPFGTMDALALSKHFNSFESLGETSPGQDDEQA